MTSSSREDKGKSRVTDDYGVKRLRVSGRKVKDGRVLSTTMRLIKNLQNKSAGASKQANRATRGSGSRAGANPNMQRCAVRMSYSANKVGGQWKAHGRYIAREGAAHQQDPDQGFTADGHAKVADTLDRWQGSGDPRLFKFILSPEFGQDMNSLEAFTRDFMQKLEGDLGVGLEWVAVDHYNTDHPHVHVALRGVDRDGNDLLIDPGYVKSTMRHRAQEAATEQLGYRTERQRYSAFEKEVSQDRFTSLDRAIQKKAKQTPDGHSLVDYGDKIPKSQTAKDMRLFQLRRIHRLEKMGLAEPAGHMQWVLQPDMPATLKKLQEQGDILKSIHGARDIRSDPRMPVRKTQLQLGEAIEGRVIATGEDETVSKPYVLLESTEGLVHHLYQTQAMQKARNAGTLKRGDYISVEAKHIEKDGRKVAVIAVKNHGSGVKLLKDKKHLAGQVLRSIEQHKAMPKKRALAGWLGEYQKAIRNQGAEMLRAGVIRPVVGGYEIAKPIDRQPQQPPLPTRQEKGRGVSR